MRYVSLNLDRQDAARLRSTLLAAIAACPCGNVSPPRGCEDCEALTALATDLDRLLDPASRPVWPEPPLLGYDHRPSAKAIPTRDFETRSVTNPARDLRVLQEVISAPRIDGSGAPAVERDPPPRA